MKIYVLEVDKNEYREKKLAVEIDGNDCWNVISHQPKDTGYIAFTRNGKHIRIHRYIYEKYFGPIPKGLFVCHSCDNRKCINPKHLWLGTNRENLQDMIEKGRNNNQKLSVLGEDNSQAKLTEKDIISIRKERKTGLTMKSLAQKYNVSDSNIHRIIHRQLWSHI